MMRTVQLALAQRVGVSMVGRARHRAARARPRLASAPHTVMVAIRAAAAQWRGVGIQRAAKHAALPLAVLLHGSAAHARVLVGMVVRAEARAATQRVGMAMLAALVHLAPRAAARLALALSLRRPYTPI